MSRQLLVSKIKSKAVSVQHAAVEAEDLRQRYERAKLRAAVEIQELEKLVDELAAAFD